MLTMTWGMMSLMNVREWGVGSGEWGVGSREWGRVLRLCF